MSPTSEPAPATTSRRRSSRPVTISCWVTTGRTAVTPMFGALCQPTTSLAEHGWHIGLRANGGRSRRPTPCLHGSPGALQNRMESQNSVSQALTKWIAQDTASDLLNTEARKKWAHLVWGEWQRRYCEEFHTWKG